MQTFLPFPDFKRSFESLDKSRCQKQIIEASQLLDTLFNIPTIAGTPRQGFLNHPALNMWRNNAGSLVDYFETGIEECERRSIKTVYCRNKLSTYRSLSTDSSTPSWLGDPMIHESHQSRLLQKPYESALNDQKNYERLVDWYRNQNFEAISLSNLFDMDYQWPVMSGNNYALQTKISKDRQKIKKNLVESFGLNPYLKEKL